MIEQQDDAVSIVSSCVYILRCQEWSDPGVLTYTYRVAIGIGFEKILEEKDEYLQKCQIVVVFGVSPIFYSEEDAWEYSRKLQRNTGSYNIKRLRYDKPYPIEVSLLSARQKVRLL